MAKKKKRGLPGVISPLKLEWFHPTLVPSWESPLFHDIPAVETARQVFMRPTLIQR